MGKTLLWGALFGAGAAAIVLVAFLVSMSKKGGEAGADWAFVALFASPYILGIGAAAGMAVAALIRGMRSLLKG